MQRGQCKQGDSAFCCKGRTPPSSPALEPPRWTEKIKKVRETFKFLNEHKCDSSTWPTREELPEQANVEDLSSDCKNSYATIMAQMVGMLALPKSPDFPDAQRELKIIWDENIGRLWRWFQFDTLVKFLQNEPIGVVKNYVIDVRTIPKETHEFREELEAVRTGFCYYYPPRNAGEDRAEAQLGVNSSSIMRRHIKNDMDRSNYEFRKPTFGDVFDGVKEGDLSFHFAQLMYYWATNDGQKPGPIISLAYWIGRQPGRLQAPQEEMRLDKYRDTFSARVDQQAIDRWIVIHLHFSPQGNPPPEGVLSEGENGHKNIEIAHITMFHANSITCRRDKGDEREDWFIYDNKKPVEGRPSNTQRANLECPENGLFKVTHDMTKRRFSNKALEPMGLWLGKLYENRYLDLGSFGPLTDKSTGNKYGEVKNDALKPHGVWRPTDDIKGNTENKGSRIFEKPYNANFLIEGVYGDGKIKYNFNPVYPNGVLVNQGQGSGTETEDE